MTDAAIDAQARADLKGHVDVCTERYGNLWSAIKDIKGTLDSDRVARAEATKAIHERLNTVSNRMWLAVCSVCGGSVLGLAGVVFYLLTHR